MITVLARDQRVGLVVADDLLSFGIKFQYPPDARGDVA
jgi:hypothetical protein